MEHVGVTTGPRSSIVFWRLVFDVMKGWVIFICKNDDLEENSG